MLRALLLVGLGGAFGSMARYVAGIILNKYVSHPFPYATFTVNIVGCFVIGLLYGFGQKNQLQPGDWWLLTATGFCGGFTTFSAFALENVNLMRTGNSTMAYIYIAASVILGLLVCRMGIALVNPQ